MLRRVSSDGEAASSLRLAGPSREGGGGERRLAPRGEALEARSPPSPRRVRDPALDAEVLMSNVLGTTRSELSRISELTIGGSRKPHRSAMPLGPSSVALRSSASGRRNRRTPRLSHLGARVDRRRDVPRPETSLLVEAGAALFETEARAPTSHGKRRSVEAPSSGVDPDLLVRQDIDERQIEMSARNAGAGA